MQTEIAPTRRVMPVKEFALRSNLSEAALRALIFNEEKNKFSKCIRRIGRRILIDEASFFQWLDEQNNARGGQRA